MKKSILLFSLLLVVLILNPLYLRAEVKNEISITAVEVKNSTATITINNCLKIEDIQLVYDEESKNYLKFPEYIDKDAKTVPYVTVLNDEAKNIIEEAVYNNKPSDKVIKSINYKIADITLYEDEKSNIKALAIVVFNEAISVEVRVLETEGKLWVMWPMRKDKETNQWVKQIEVTKKPIRDMIEKIIIKKYKKLI